MNIIAPSSSLESKFVAKNQPGREDLVVQLTTLLTSPSPYFVYLYDPLTPTLTRALLQEIVSELSKSPSRDTGIVYAFVNCVACLTPRVLFDTILNALANFEPTWTDGCSIWSGGAGQGGGWNESFDTFLHGIRAVYSELLNAQSKSAIGGQSSQNEIQTKIILVFERVERLKDTFPGLILPLTRLAELAQLDIVTIFLSDISWDDVRPCAGGFTDPYRITIEPVAKEDTITMLAKAFPAGTSSTAIDPYSPNLQPLFVHFVETVYNVCSPFTPDPNELAYIIAARWPGFVAPVLEDMRAQGEGPYHPPAEDARMRLTRLFSASLSNAVATLYPRFMNAAEWSAANSPPAGLRLSQSLGQQLPPPASVPQGHEQALELPRMSVFILVASFLASFNPAKSDKRMFGRARDENVRRRRKGGATRKSKPGTAVKIPQRLLGPVAFPFDRLIAILGSLLEEHDIDTRLPSSYLGDSTEVEVSRVQLYASIQELVSMRLLQRTTPIEKIDGPMFKSVISLELALKLARQIEVTLSDLMWEPN